MFNKTGNQLKKVGKEVISIFTSLRDDIRLECKIAKELRLYKKELYELAKEQEADATRAHEETQS